MGSLLLSPASWCTQGSVCALQESVSPVLFKFWWLYGGVKSNLLQEGLCHTQVCCTHCPQPWTRPLLTHTSTGDSWTLMDKSGSVSCVETFHYRGLECKSRKSRGIWNNRQIWPWSTEGSRANICQENTLVIASTLFQ